MLAGLIVALYAIAPAGADVKVNQDTDNSVQNEPSIVINRHYTSDPLNVVVAYNDIGKSLGVSWSPDGGANWTDVQLPQMYTASTGDPSVAADVYGNVYACFLSYDAGTTFYGSSGIFVSKSTDGGRSWLAPYAVDNQVWPGSGPPVPFVDKCMMTVDTVWWVDHIYVAWQRDNVDGVHSDIYFSYSNNGGISYSTPIKINDNALGTGFCEGAFPFVGAMGDVYVVWYDSYFQGHEPGTMYIDKSTDGGLTFGTDVQVVDFLAPPKYTYANSGFKAKSFPSAAASPFDINNLYITYTADPDGYFDKRISNGYPPGVPPSASGGEWPVVERNGNYVYSVWRDRRAGANYDLFFNVSSDNGQSWQTPDIGPLDNGDTPNANQSWQQKLSSSGNNVYCVWEDYRNGVANVYFNYSTNNGLTWNADRRLDNAPAGIAAGNPVIASSGNNVYVAWMDLRNGNGDIYFTNSANNGLTWSTPQRIDAGDAPGVNDSHSPKLACVGNYVYCTWIDNRNSGYYQVYFNYSSNAGAGWQSNSTQVSWGTGYTCTMPVRGGLEATGTFVYACWESDSTSPGVGEIMFNSSTDNGWTWNQPLHVSDAGAYCSMPYLDYEGNNVYIGWMDDRVSPGSFMYDIYFDYSTDNGASWHSPDINIDHAMGVRDQTVTIKSEGNYVYACWLDGRMWGGMNYDVFFNVSADGGQTWGSEALVNHGTKPVGLQLINFPVMEAGNNYVNIIWPDPRMWGIPNVYTNYSADNGATFLSGMDEADVFLVVSRDGGSSWSTPFTVNDDGTDYAQVLPWVAVKENGFVDITYYNFRPTPINPQFPGAELRMAVRDQFGYLLAPSAPIQDTVVTPMTNWVGEYNGMASDGDFLYTVFTDFEQSGNSDIYLDITENPTIGDCQGMCGDVNFDAKVNVSDAVYIINFVFSGGTEPQPVKACGDANDDAKVNVSDAVFIINFVFSGGSQPDDCSPGGELWYNGDCCPYQAYP